MIRHQSCSATLTLAVVLLLRQTVELLSVGGKNRHVCTFWAEFEGRTGRTCGVRELKNSAHAVCCIQTHYAEIEKLSSTGRNDSLAYANSVSLDSL